MDVRLLAAVAGDLDGVKVAGLCRERGISRKTFYKWRGRFEAEGLAGLEPRSRRPHRSPGATPMGVEDRVVELRKELTEEGLDAGAGTIRWHLGRQGVVPLPSEATVWRVLVRRGFVVPEPRKRPKSATRRFAAAFPNECWQIDATEWRLTRRRVEIINILDDHSRLVVASMAVPSTTSDAAWAAFSGAASRWGLPVRCLSDNGLAFSGRLRGYEVTFEANLRAAGIRPVTARPFHPQTCGKVERFQQTLKKWLRARRRARTLADLQAQLDRFVAYYNHQRPHHGIGRAIPFDRWTALPAARSAGIPVPAPLRRSRLRVDPNGTAVGNRWAIAVGVEWAGHDAEVRVQDGHATVFIGDHLVRHLDLDPTRHYQPSGRPRGGPRRPRRP